MRIGLLTGLVFMVGCARTALPIDIVDPPRACLGSGGASSSAAAGTTGSSASTGATTGASSTASTTGSGTTMSNGPRLRSYYRLTEDGVKETIPNRWFDMGRKEDCSFLRTAVGEERCLPAALALAPVFADGACSKPLVVVPVAASCPAPLPAYVEPWVEPADQCAQHRRRFKVGAAASVEAPYRMEGGACVATVIGMGAEVYALGEEVPLEDFSPADIWHY